VIPFLDLKAQYRQIKPQIDAAVMGVVESGNYVLGPQVEAFEERFADYCAVRHCKALNSGTSALHLALLAAGVGPGDEVITVSMTFVATAAAILYCGARPVYVDVDPVSWTMDPACVEAAITPRTKAILPVHLHGLMADMDPIMEIARRHKLVVIEDAAQAHGAEYKGRRIGSIGDMACFSFYPGKNLGAYGEGGAVTTNDAAFAKRLRMLRDWGSEKRYYHDIKGGNYRMEGVQGAVLGVKMKYIEGWTESRRKNAALYNKLLEGTPYVTPKTPSDLRHVSHVYAIAHPKRDALQTYLTEKGVSSGIHYPVPVHLQKCFSELNHKPGDFPHSEKAAAQTLSLPMYPELKAEQIEEVVAALKSWPEK